MGFDPDKKFWVDERVYEHMSLRRQGRGGAERVEEQAAGPLARGLPGDGRRLGSRVAGQAARRLAAGAADVRGGRGDRLALGRAEDDGGVRRVRPDDDRRRRRPGRVDEDGVRRRRRVLARARRAQRAVRHPRARHGRDRQRRVRARRHRQAVRLDVLDVLRLHARQRAAVGADGTAGRVGVDARLRRPRRGRPDAPADRALRLAARDPRAVGDPPGRRQRDGGRLAGRAGTRGRPRGAAAVAPEHPHARPRRGRERRRCSSAAATRCGTPTTTPRPS